MTERRASSLLVCGAVGLAACNDERGIDLERMIEQHRYSAYGENPLFSDRRSMRQPPPGTVQRAASTPAEVVSTGIEHGRYVDVVPLPVDRRLVLRGRDRFDVFCATCHGKRGDGHAQVAENMRLRPPPSFYESPVSELPVGRIYRVVSGGYGLMPSYARQLEPADRWAVVAYVDVLRLSRLGSEVHP
jgi:mono/diheme cytochrome c family protein